MTAGAPPPVASLPMYDWPEVRWATDALWVALRDGFRARGIRAPDALDRGRPYHEPWTDPGLVLSQTCSLPYCRQLQTRVTLLGAPDYRLEGCPPGFYRSVLIVRRGDRRHRIDHFAGARYAYNDALSQSGYGALLSAFGAVPRGEGLMTGAHRVSIRAVAEGQAEIAAVDAAVWRLAERYEPAAAGVRVIGSTPPTPATPMITAGGRDAGLYAEVVEQGIARIGQRLRQALGIGAFVRLGPADYVDSG